MYDYWGERIYQELRTLNTNFSAFVTWIQDWAAGITEFWDQLFLLFPPLIFMLVLFVGVNFMMKLFFPKWGEN